MATYQDIDERSSLWGLSAAAAPAVGFGIGMRGNWQDLANAVKRPLYDYTSTAKKIQELGKLVEPTISSEIRPLEYFGNMISSSVHHTEMSRDIAQAAYQSIMAGKNPIGHNRAYATFQNILANASTPMQAYGSAEKFIREFGGNANIFEKEIERITKGNTYNKGLGTTVISQPILPIRAQRIDKRSLLGEELAEYKRIQSELAETLGKENLGRSYLLQAKGVRVLRTNVKGTSSRIDLPLNSRDVLPMGRNLEQQYALRQAYSLEDGGIQFKSYTDQYLEVLKRNKNRSAKQAVIATNAQLIDNLNREGAAKRLAIWTPPEEFMTSGGLARRNLLRYQAVYAGEGFSPDILKEAISSGLFPGGSQNAMGSGTLYLRDIRESLYGPLGELFPANRMPTQFLRSEWGLSKSSKLLANSDQFGFRGMLGEHMGRLERPFMGPGYNRLMGIEEEIGDWASNKAQWITSFSKSSAHVTPQMLTFYAKPGTGGFESQAVRESLAGEMGIISTQVTDALEFERIVPKKVRYLPGLEINEAVESVIKANKIGLKIGQPIEFYAPAALKGGQLLGISPTGQRVLGGGSEGIAQEIVGLQPMSRDVVSVYVKESFKMNEGMIAKMFGLSTKHLMEAKRQEIINSMIATVSNSARTSIGGNTVNAFMSGERLAKNPFALFSQQLTAMSAFMAERQDMLGNKDMAAWRRELPKTRAFLSDPIKYLGLNQIVANAGQISTEELQYRLQANLVTGAQKLGVWGGEYTPGIFGMTPEKHLSRMVTEGILSSSEATSISTSKGVYGLESMFLGDLVSEGGAGNRMKMDPSGIRLLAQKSYAGDATLGRDLAADVVTRFEKSNGLVAAQKMQETLVGMGPNKLESLLGPKAIPIGKMGAPTEAGQWIDLGQGIKEFGGSSRIYRPGIAELSAMAPVMGNTGEMISSELARGFSGLQHAVARGDVTEIEAAAKGLREVGFKEYATRSAASSRVIGSRQLTAKRLTAAETKELGGAVGISEATGREMFQEVMERASEADKVGLAEMQERFLKGESVAGILGRHPHVSPESLQLSQIRAMKGAKDHMIYTPYEYGEVGGILEDISKDTGMKTDYDKDMLTLNVVKNKDLEKRASRALVSDVGEGYNKFLANHYMLARMMKKEDSAVLRGEQALQSEALAAAYNKMAAGPTNIALQKMKLAVSANKPEHYNELAAMFSHIEERASLNVKHGMIAGSDLYTRLSKAVDTVDEDALRGIYEDVFGKEERTLSAELKGKTYSIDYSPTKAARTSAEALRESGRDVALSQELASVGKSGKVLTRERMAEHLAFSREGLSLDVGQRMVRGIEEGEGSILSMASRRIKGLTNKASQVASVMSRAKKPLVLGALAGAAIMMSAPAVSGSLKNPNKEGPAGGHNVDMMNSMPPSGPGMSIPKARIQRSPRTYSLPSSRMTGSYDSRDLDKDYNGAMRYASSMNSSSVNARMHVNDNRSAMDPRMLANKIHEQM